MAFSLLDLGPLSAAMQEYADLDGLVPERGDRWQEFHWAHQTTKRFSDTEAGEQCWQDFVSKAVTGTHRAIDALDDLQDWGCGRSHHHL